MTLNKAVADWPVATGASAVLRYGIDGDNGASFQIFYNSSANMTLFGILRFEKSTKSSSASPAPDTHLAVTSVSTTKPQPPGLLAVNAGPQI
jgi:hypothetical protein